MIAMEVTGDVEIPSLRAQPGGWADGVSLTRAAAPTAFPALREVPNLAQIRQGRVTSAQVPPVHYLVKPPSARMFGAHNSNCGASFHCRKEASFGRRLPLFT
jgi:hypothetical protein